MSNISFLDSSQINGESKLEIFKKFGISSSMSGFAILLGGIDGYWWTLTHGDNNKAFLVDENENLVLEDVNSRQIGIRPIIPFSEIKQFCSNESVGISGVREVEYGEYPQTVMSEYFSDILENMYINGYMKYTGRSYTTDSVHISDKNRGFNLSCYPECSYGDKKYIRFLADSRANGSKLPDGRIVKAGNIYWIAVEPITWLVDEEADIAITKEILLAGLQFSNDKNYIGDFDKTDIKKNLDNNFSLEILTSRINYERQKAFLKEFGEIKDLISVNYFDLATKKHRR